MKHVSLAEAVRRTVLAGDTVLFAFTHNRAHAAAWEVARQFRDTRALTLVATGLLEYAAILVSAGAVGRLESAFAGTTYPAPSPLRVLQQAMADVPGSDPDFTNLTMTLRLMAGALGWPFVPTGSLTGSGLFDREGRAMLRDPFTGAEIAVLPALKPDVAFLHVPVADTLGNAIVHGPDAEECWGARAARRLVVTAERVMEPEAFRRIGPRRGIPAALVDCVVEAPFGAHPQGQFVWSEEEGIASYAEDYAARAEFKALARDPATLRTWVETHVFGKTHADYLAQLGAARLQALRKAALDPEVAVDHNPDAAPEPEEIAAWHAMLLAEEAVASGRAHGLFAGIGLAHLAAWGAEARCRRRGLAVDLIAETGMIGFRPMAGDPYLFNRPNAASSLFHANFIETLGVLAGAQRARCLVMLAAAQIDRHGNLNSSRAADQRFIVGSGGANDLGASPSPVLVVMPLKPGRFADPLPFLTSRITNLAAIATDLCRMERGPDGALRVTGLICRQGAERDTLARIAALTGNAVLAIDAPDRRDPPQAADLAALRRFDPTRAILG